MLHPPHSEGENGISWTTQPPVSAQRYIRMSNSRTSSFHSPLEIQQTTQLDVNIPVQSTKRSLCEQPEESVVKRMKVTYADTSNVTPTPSQPDSLRIQIQRYQSPPMRPSSSTTRTEPTESHIADLNYDTIKAMNDAIDEVRKALTAMRKASNSKDRRGVKKYLLKAMETLRTCHEVHFVPRAGDKDAQTLVTGENTPVIHTPASLIGQDRCCSSRTEMVDVPALSRVVASSGIEPSQELRQLREKQNRDMREKDMELEATRGEVTSLNENIRRLEKDLHAKTSELHAKSLESQSATASHQNKPNPEVAALRLDNEALRKRIKAQTAHLSSLQAKIVPKNKGLKQEVAIVKKSIADPIKTSLPMSESSPPVSHKSTAIPAKSAGTLATASILPVEASHHLERSSSVKKVAGAPSLPGMGKKGQKKARAAERKRLSDLEQNKTSEAKNAATIKPKEVLSGALDVRSASIKGTQPSDRSIPQKSIDRPVPTTGPSASIKNTVRPDLRWPDTESSTSALHHSATERFAAASQPSGEKVPDGQEYMPDRKRSQMDEVSKNGIQIRGRGQVRDLRDGSAKLRMDAWDVCMRRPR